MFKKLFSVLLALAVLLPLICALPLSTADAATSGDYTYTVNSDGKTVTITDYTGSDTVVNVPSDINGYEVTIIGFGAFSWCEKITDLTLPYGVTTIERDAFMACTNLVNIYFPDSLTIIGDVAFMACENLKSITIPDSVTKIGNCSFLRCYSLEEVHLGNGLTFIDDLAFWECNSLKSITIPKSVTELGYRVFDICDSLETIIVEKGNPRFHSAGNCIIETETKTLFYGCNGSVIPDDGSVTSIRRNAFSGQTGLTEITIPDTVTEIGVEAFYGCYSLSSITIPDGITQIDNYTFWECYALTTVVIPKTVTRIGNGAFCDCLSLTDIYYGGSVTEWSYVSVEQNNDYLTNVDVHLGVAPVITKRTGTTVIMKRNGVNFDLLKDRQTFGKSSDETVSIIVVPNWQGHEKGKILLSQGGTNYIENKTGVFKDIKPADVFSPRDDIYVALVTKDGKTIDLQKIQLQILSTEDEQSEGSFLQGDTPLIKAINFIMPDVVPGLGGHEFSFDVGSINTEFEIDGNEFKVVLGHTVLSGKQDENGKWKKEDFKGFKEGFKKLAYDILVGQDPRTELEKLIEGPKSVKGWSGSVNVAGYLEGFVDENGLHIYEGGVVVSGQLGYTQKGQTYVYIIPVYYEVGGGVSVSFSGGAKGYIPNAGIAGAFTGTFSVSPYLEIGGGVGFVDVATAGASGKVQIALEIALDKDYQKVLAKGSANFEVTTVFGVNYTKPFPEGSWLIYETGNPNALIGSNKSRVLLSGGYGLYDLLNEIDLDAPVTLEDRDYLLEESEWLGGAYGITPFAVDYTNKELSVLQTNAYSEIAPVISYMDGKKVMAWITDNADREAINKCMLVYSVYDDATATWSEPLTIYDNGTPDYYPEMADGYIVWQKANKELDGTASLNDLSRASEIYIAEWNGNGFDTPIRLTENDTLDTKPLVTVEDGVAHVVWYTNSEDNFLGTSGTNSVMYRTFDGETIGETVTAVNGLNSITNMSVNYSDALNIYYVTDSDNDLSTIDDRDIYLCSGSEIIQITSNDIIDSNPTAANINGDEWLFYYSDGNIFYKNSEGTFKVFEDGATGLTDDFDVITNGSDIVITWTTVNDGSAEVLGVFYDGNGWSKDVQISDLGARVKYPDGLMEEDGTLVLAFNRTEKVATEDYYEDGQADLCTLRVTPSYDLEVSSAVLGTNELSIGTNTLFVGAANNGELPVNGYRIEVVGESGDILGSYTSSQSLSAGEEVSLEVNFNIPEGYTAQTVYVIISADNIEEYDTDNNGVSLTLGEADVKITDTAIGEDKILVTVTNSGFESVSDITVELKNGDSTVYMTETVDVLGAKETVTVEFDIDYSTLSYTNSLCQLTASVSAEADKSEYNNSATVNINESILTERYTVELHSMDNIAAGGVVNTNVKNNFQTEKEAVVTVSVYDGNGDFVAEKTESVTLLANDYTTVDFVFDGMKLKHAYTAEISVLQPASGGSSQLDTADYPCSDFFEKPYSMGDVDRNYETDALDYVLVRRHIMGTYTLKGLGFAVSDIDGNGRIGAFDYLLLRRDILGTYVLPEIESDVPFEPVEFSTTQMNNYNYTNYADNVFIYCSQTEGQTPLKWPYAHKLLLEYDSVTKTWLVVDTAAGDGSSAYMNWTYGGNRVIIYDWCESNHSSGDTSTMFKDIKPGDVFTLDGRTAEQALSGAQGGFSATFTQVEPVAVSAKP